MQFDDLHNRSFKTLRISLTNVCNLSCIYCVAEAGTQDREPDLNRTYASYLELLAHISGIHQSCDLRTVRLTGGEPLLYRELIPLIQGMHALQIPAIKLTTNGYLLKEKASQLREAGISSINVSLDAIDPAVFFELSGRRNLNKILEGIDAAIASEISIKLNAVILKGKNDNQILPLLNYAKSKGIQIRFLEMMKMGHLHDAGDSHFFSEQQILERIASQESFTKLPRRQSATANIWQTTDGYTFGIIANESSPFCSDCDRLRIDSAGNLYGCLSSNIPIAIVAGESTVLLEQKLQLAMSHKQNLRFTGSKLSMLEIGG